MAFDEFPAPLSVSLQEIEAADLTGKTAMLSQRGALLFLHECTVSLSGKMNSGHYSTFWRFEFEVIESQGLRVTSAD